MKAFPSFSLFHKKNTLPYESNLRHLKNLADRTESLFFLLIQSVLLLGFMLFLI